jgi:hypothetical protein
MACPECRSDVSDKAISCPKCGFPIREFLHEKASDENSSTLPEAPKTAQIEVSAENGAMPKLGQAEAGSEPTESFKEISDSPETLKELKERARQEATAKNGSSGDSTTAKPYKGIGPWLRVLCFFLIAQPIFEGFGLYGQMKGIDPTEEFQRIVNASYFLAAVKFFIGISLLRELRKDKSWGTIHLTAVLIWVAWPVATFLEFFVFPELFLGQLLPHESGDFNFAAANVFISTLFAVVWTCYFYQSERLAVTFRAAEWRSLKNR